jgi:hypothetical protein
MSIETTLRKEEHDEFRLVDVTRNEANELYLIRKILERAFPEFLHANVFQFKQDGGNNMSAGKITGTPVGSTSTFGETDPAGFTDPAGAVRTWTLTDPSNSTTGTPSTDALVAQFSVAAAATAPVGSSYTIQFTDTSAAGVVLTTSGPITVPFLAAVVSAPLDDVVNQLN